MPALPAPGIVATTPSAQPDLPRAEQRRASVTAMSPESVDTYTVRVAGSNSVMLGACTGARRPLEVAVRSAGRLAADAPRTSEGPANDGAAPGARHAGAAAAGDENVAAARTATNGTGTFRAMRIR